MTSSLLAHGVGTGSGGLRALPVAAMGASKSTPSVDSDLRALKAHAASARERQEAFERLRRQFLTPIGAAELLKAKADIEALRFPMWQEPPLDATRLSREAQRPEMEINRAC